MKTFLKRYCRILTVISCILLCLLATGCAKKGKLIKTAQNNEYQFGIYSDHIELLSYIGSASEVEIPSKIKGKKVTVLGNNLFASCSNLSFPSCKIFL